MEDDWSKINKRFNKALVYSVVHFFESIEDVRRLLSGLLKVLEDDFIILLGEVRDKKMYMDFKKNQKNKKFSLRNVKFFFNKLFNSFYLSKLSGAKDAGLTPVLFDAKEIFSVCRDLGIEAHLIKQDKRHPFYNTCVDYVLRKKR